MRKALSSGGDLGEFILAELNRRGIAMRKVTALPQLLATWRSHTTPDVKDRPTCLVLSVRACTFGDIASFCSALFSGSRKESPHVLFTKQSATGTTLLVNARQQSDRDRKQCDREFDFLITGGSGHFSWSDSGIVVFFHGLNTTTFILAEAEEGIEIVFTKHKTV
jgi:hypothetical protein